MKLTEERLYGILGIRHKKGGISMNSIYQKMTLDRNIPVPLYYQLKQYMIDHIQNGDLKDGELVPPEEELCSQLKISRPTIRQAFTELAHEGYLNRVKAKGTFITHPQISGNFIQNIESFNQEMKNKGLQPKTVILSLKEVSSLPEIAEKLALKKGAKVLQMERLRYADDKVIVYVKTFLPAQRFKKLLQEDLENHSLYELLDTQFNVEIERVNRHVHAVPAAAYISEHLMIEENDPVLYVSTIAYDRQSNPVEYSLASYRSDLYMMSIDLCKNRS